MGDLSFPAIHKPASQLQSSCVLPLLQPHSPFLWLNPHHAQFQGGDTSESDILWANGEDGISFVHPSSELYLQPLAGKCPTPYFSAWPVILPSALSYEIPRT